ncbi:MAG: hypothetical protein ACRD2L_09460 [Terriglobia bacterium]
MGWEFIVVSWEFRAMKREFIVMAGKTYYYYIVARRGGLSSPQSNTEHATAL